jgi:hypothetical protein
MKKHLLILSLLVLGSCSQTDLRPTDATKGLPKTKVSSLASEPYLKDIFDKVGFKQTKNGRKSNLGINVDTDSILMALQADGFSYSYTFKVEENGKNGSFTNLVFKRVVGGVKGFYLKYEPDSSVPFSIDKFTGKMTSYDLDMNVITSQRFVNGALGSPAGKGGRTQGCQPTYTFAYECPGSGVSSATGADLPCLYGARTMVITLDYSGCIPTNEEGGGGGLPTQYTVWSDGTFVVSQYFNNGGPGGGPSGGGGSGNCGGDGVSAPTNGSDPNSCSDVIGVYPPSILTIKEVVDIALASNPFFLIEIPCDQLPKWQALAQHTPPQPVIDKLKNLDDNYTSIISGDWDIQYIENATSPIVNMDYFPVTISKLPKDPATGLQFTPDDFLNYVRKNLNSFFEGNDTEFGPYNSTEAVIWNSTNYFGAIMRFDILLRVGGVVVGQQDGSVICSSQNGNTWRFTTIESPRDWSHPVSGTREFGLTTNEDGTYTFYTRGVDRVAESTDDFIGGLPLIQSPYDGGDALWTQFQENLKSYIEQPQNAGLALIQTPVISRPDWEKVKAVLRGDRPISDLGCD